MSHNESMPKPENETEVKPQSNWRKRAEKNGYTINSETGVIYDAKGRKVTGVKLDSEYPELASTCETIAQQYDIPFDDSDTFKYEIYKNGEHIQSYSEQTINDIFALYKITLDPKYKTHNSTTEQILLSYSEQDIKDASECISSFFAKLPHETNNDYSTLQHTIGREILENYNKDFFTDSFIDKLVEQIASFNQDSTYDHGLGNYIIGQIANQESGDTLEEYLSYYKKLEDEEDEDEDYVFPNLSLFLGYTRRHGFSTKTKDGFENIIIPLKEAAEPEAKALTVSGGLGNKEEYWGITDFTEECFLSYLNPKEINKLLRIYSEIPMSNTASYEQSRIDSVKLDRIIIHAHDFVHDQLPGTHKILQAMLDYYNHRNDPDVEQYRDAIEKIDNQYKLGVLPEALNIDAYDTQIAKKYPYEEGPESIKAIEILERLVENTKPKPLEIPNTKNEQLNELLTTINPIINEANGEVIVDFNKVTDAVKEMNTLLLNNQNEQGIFPSFISAIAFLEKTAAYAIRNCDKKELAELPFDPRFKEIVRFSQLTSSTKYSESEFEKNYSRLKESCGKAYEEDRINYNQSREGYRILNQWIVGNSMSLANEYAKKNRTKRWEGAVWSGNLSDELIGIFDRF